MQARYSIGHDVNGRAGGAAVAVVILLLIAGGFAAYWFVFRTSEPVPLGPNRDAATAGRSEMTGLDESASIQGLESTAEYSADVTIAPLSPSDDPLPVTSTGAVDWNARKVQLKERYRRAFLEPKIGTDMTVRLASGTKVEGRISDLSKDTISLRIGGGHATYRMGQLSRRSQTMIFRDVYSEYASRRTLSKEKAAAAAPKRQDGIE